MFGLFRSSLRTFRSNLKRYIFFEMLVIFFTGFIWVPILTFIYKSTLRWMGSSTLLNKDVYNIFQSYKGILGILVIFLLCVMIIFIEIGVLIIISQKQYFNQKVDVLNALVTATKRYPKLFVLGVFQLIPFICLLILPISFSFYTIVKDKVNIPIMLTNRLNGSKIMLVLYAAGLLLFIYIFLKSIFAIHYIIINGFTGRKAVVSSFHLTKKNELKILLYLLLLNIVLLIIGANITVVLDDLLVWVVGLIKSPLVSNYLLTFWSYFTYLVITMLMPVNVIFLTTMFNQLIEKKEDAAVVVVAIEKHRVLTRFENRLVRFFEGRRYLFSILLVVFLIITFILNYSITEIIFNWDVDVVAHRGYHKQAPENTISSIKEAIEQNVGAVEIDVQMTKDGVLVLNHDSTLKRVAGINKKVSDLTYKELENIRVGFTKDYAEEQIPTLEQALQEIDGKVKVIIDIKNNKSITIMAEKIVELIIAYDLLEDTYIQSFNPKILKGIRLINPDIKIGIILYAVTGDMDALDVDFYTINQNILSEAFVKNAHKKNRQIFVWTVNIDQNIRSVLKFRIDGIITDYPEKVHRILVE